MTATAEHAERVHHARQVIARRRKRRFSVAEALLQGCNRRSGTQQNKPKSPMQGSKHTDDRNGFATQSDSGVSGVRNH